MSKTSNESFLEKRRKNDELVFKAAKAINKRIDSLFKDVDNIHARYLMVNRVLNLCITHNAAYYTHEEVKQGIREELLKWSSRGGEDE